MGGVKRLVLRLALLAAVAATGPVGTGYAQEPPSLVEYTTTPKKLQAWLNYCDLFLGNEAGTKEDYPGLVRAARQGLAMSPPGEEKYTSRFLFLLAAGHEYSGNTDSAIRYYQACERICLRLRDTAELAKVAAQLRGLYKNDGQDSAADVMMKRLLYLDQTTRNDTIRNGITSSLATYYLEHGEYEQALAYSLRQLAVNKRKRVITAYDSSGLGTQYTRIGEIEEALSRFDRALHYYHQALPYMSRYEVGKVHVLGKLMASHLGLHHIDSALLYFQRMQRAAGGQKIHQEEVAYAAMTLASFYHDAGDIARADALAGRAYAIAQSGCSEFCLMQARYMMGRVALTRKQFSTALQYLAPAISFAAGSAPELEMDLCQMAAQAYAGIGDYQRAFQQQSRYAVLRDTATAQQNRRALTEVTTEMDTKYKTVAREQRIALLNKNNRLQAAALTAATRQRLLAIAGLLLLAGLAATLTIGYRNKQRTAAALDQKNQQLGILNKELDEANQTKARLFGIISHDLRAPVSQLYQFIQLQQNSPGLLSPEAAARYGQQISEGAAHLLDTMEDILLWSKSQMDGFRPIHTPIRLATIADAVVSLLKPLAENKSVILESGIATSLVIRSDGNILHLILRNLVQNAIQHSPPGGRVTLTTENHASLNPAGVSAATWIDIVDEAPPLPDALVAMLEHSWAGKEQMQPEVGSDRTGLGLQLVAELASKLGIEIIVFNPAPESGRHSKTIRVAFPDAR